jgi:hypothetical protein
MPELADPAGFAIGEVLVAGVAEALFAGSSEPWVAQQRRCAKRPIAAHDYAFVGAESVAADRAAQPLADHRAHRRRIPKRDLSESELTARETE